MSQKVLFRVGTVVKVTHKNKSGEVEVIEVDVKDVCVCLKEKGRWMVRVDYDDPLRGRVSVGLQDFVKKMEEADSTQFE